MRIVLLHAYSSRNAGDGLLVDVSVALLLRLGVRQEDIHLVAVEPESFRAAHTVTGALGTAAPAARFSQLRRAGAGLRELLGFGRVRRLIEEADAVVAVGGGYLKSRTVREGITTLLAHGSQLRFAARSGAATVYLPQSIGPLDGPIGAVLRRWLHGLRHVAVRDDPSLSEVPQALRVPDLGLLELARVVPALRPGDGSIALVARRLPASAGYKRRLRAFAENLAASGHPVHTALQSSAGTGNDDRGFALHLGLQEPTVTLQQRLTSSARLPSLVVSVRLHGCVQALLAGVPTVHLGYEPKGSAAFADLGLSEFVHNATTFSPERVAMQCRTLLRDPSAYWNQLTAALPVLADRGAAYERYLAQTLGIVDSGPTVPAATACQTS